MVVGLVMTGIGLVRNGIMAARSPCAIAEPQGSVGVSRADMVLYLWSQLDEFPEHAGSLRRALAVVLVCP